MFLWGCGSPKTSEEVSSEEYIESYTQDTIVFPPEYMQVQSEEHIAQIDSQGKRRKTEKDSISEIEDQKRPFELTQLDTISLLPEIKRNKEILNQQQLILDSLLKKK